MAVLGECGCRNPPRAPRAHQLHALDVEVLAARVLDAHVDGAGEAEARGGGGRGDAVLAGPGLGDDARLCPCAA